MGAQFIYLGLFLACVGGWVGTHGMHIVFVDLEHLYKRLPHSLASILVLQPFPTSYPSFFPSQVQHNPHLKVVFILLICVQN